MTKTFFSKNEAERFAEKLKAQGFENITIWTDRDAFKQRIFIVKWY